MERPYISLESLIERLKRVGVFTPFLEKALTQAQKSHGNQRRVLGTPYLEEHIYPVVLSLLDSCTPEKPEEKLIAAALLHDVLEDDASYSSVDMERDFGRAMVDIVQPLTKLYSENRETASQNEKRAVNEKMLKKLYDAPKFSKLIKLADRLNNISCIYILKESQPERFLRVINETKELYIPFAKEVSPYFYEKLIRVVTQLTSESS